MSRIIKCDRCGGEVNPKKIGYVSIMQRGKRRSRELQTERKGGEIPPPPDNGIRRGADAPSPRGSAGRNA